VYPGRASNVGRSRAARWRARTRKNAFSPRARVRRPWGLRPAAVTEG
jgi:hypothetical protein